MNLILTTALAAFVIILAVFLFIILMQKMQNYTANQYAGKISQEIKNTLTASPYFHLLDDSEKKKYRGKFGLIGILVYVIILIALFIIGYRESGTISIANTFLVSSPFALIILILVIRDFLRVSPGKEVYCVRAFCVKKTSGSQASYTFVYHNFLRGLYEGGCIGSTASIRKKGIAAGGYCDILVCPGKNRMQMIDVA